MKKEENYLVYLIQMGASKYYKIGITKNVNNRLSSLQTGNPLPLHIVATIKVEDLVDMGSMKASFMVKEIEKSLHRKYAYCRQVGEWFKFEKEEDIQIKQWAEKYVINDATNYVNFLIEIGKIPTAQPEEEF